MSADHNEATALAFNLVERAQNHPDIVEHDDGVVRSTYLVRSGDRLHQPHEPWVWWNLSGEGCPRTEYNDEEAPEHLRVDESHSVRHQDAPMTTYHGWVQGAGGWVLLATDGTSWTPAAFVPDGGDQ